MSLAQTYRNQVAQHQQRRLLLYLLVAAGLHAVGAAGLGLWHGHLRHALTKPLDQPVPIDFVYIEPSPEPVAAPANTTNRSQTNAIAGAKPVNRPVQTNAQPAAPARSLQSTAVLPAPALPPSVRAVPSPVRTSPVRTSPRPVVTPAVPEPVAKPIQTIAPPAPAASPAEGANHASGNASELYSLSVESGSSAAELNQGLTPNGLQGRFNPNRSGPGASVDAAQDPWGGYLASLNRAVDQNWQRVPVAATSRTRVRFRVNQAGELFDLQVLESSGNDRADQAALQAVQAAAPFAPLPPNAEQVLIVNFTFTQWFGPDAP